MCYYTTEHSQFAILWNTVILNLVEHCHFSIWWNTVNLQLTWSFLNFGGTQSFLNLVEHSQLQICWTQSFSIWLNMVISILVEHSQFSIWWNTVISQFGGTLSICNSVEHGHFSILVDHSHFSIGWLGLTLVVDLSQLQFCGTHLFQYGGTVNCQFCGTWSFLY